MKYEAKQIPSPNISMEALTPLSLPACSGGLNSSNKTVIPIIHIPNTNPVDVKTSLFFLFQSHLFFFYIHLFYVLVFARYLIAFCEKKTQQKKKLQWQKKKIEMTKKKRVNQNQSGEGKIIHTEHKAMPKGKDKNKDNRAYCSFKERLLSFKFINFNL